MLLKKGVAGMPTKMFEGAIEAFLYEREIDWTASAHREGLHKLSREYSEGISKQAVRLTEVEEQNTKLNEEFPHQLSQSGASSEGFARGADPQF